VGRGASLVVAAGHARQGPARQALSEQRREQEAFDTYVDKFCAHISATGATPVLLAAWGYERCGARAFLVCWGVLACAGVCWRVLGLHRQLSSISVRVRA